MSRVHKPFVGILMLDTRFVRIAGDAGNVKSYAYPARTRVIEGAGSLEIVKDGLPSEYLIERFCAAAIEFEREGAKAIISTCGFLITVQNRIAAAVNIPVMVSALSLYSQVSEKHNGKTVGIITASEASLGDLALKSAGIVRDNVRIVGMEDCEAFVNAILKSKEEQCVTLDRESIEQSVIEKALFLVQRNPRLGAFILECGNLPPYANAISEATGKPVYSILDVTDQLMDRRQ